MLSKESQDIETKKVIEFIFKNKFKLAMSVAVALVMSLVITYFIPSEYSSYGIVYPPSSTSLENSVENPNFGYDIEADRILQIFQSQEIKDSTTKKFNLYSYFDIDVNSIDARDDLMTKFTKMVKFERTNYMSVAIKVRSKDPNMSANIVNYIIEKANELREKIYKQNVVLAYEKTKEELTFQKQISDSICTIVKKDLDKLNLSGLLVLATNAQLNFNDLSNKQTSIENSNIGINIINYRTQLDRQREIENKLFKIKKTLDNPVPKLYLIDKGVPSYKKVYPSYIVNSIIAIVLALIISTIVLINRSKN
ncbi:MAG: Wzz/FepE/Etk N-terminal domain-containing protein [Bacteroidota bacterium]|nr:Wzz/FepE/Etk N-terminal domain-containing protein [Bacteroidota bacterium]